MPASPMDVPQPSGWRKAYTWVFSGIGTLIISLIIAAIVSRKSSEVARDEPRFTPTPATISTDPRHG